MMKVLSIIKRTLGVTRYIPFLNSVKLRTTNLDFGSRSILIKSRINCHGRNNSIHIGNDCNMKNCHIFIKGNNNAIILADNVKAIDAEFWIEDDGNTISIDQETYIAGKTHFACTEGQCISVGKKCLFSTDIVIRTGDSHSILNDTGKRINPALPVTIGNHVWIGNKVTICKGSQLDTRP